MTHRTYLTLMTIIRLAKGILNACERWVREEFNGSDHKGDPSINQKVTEE